MAAPPTRRQTRRLSPDASGIAGAAAILRAGGLVALPTETVYGLGANALDANAVRGIFTAKQRPADDPLIVHVHSLAAVSEVADLSERARRLGERFWPGPLTLVLPKHDNVPVEVTAGLATVAVRVPSHPVARALLEACGLPIAAPSANLFGRPSPTRAEHVLADLDGRIDAVLDAGPTDVGLESTIVDVDADPPRLLRPGGLSAEAIEAVLGTRLVTAHTPSAGPQPAPGMLASHYAPRTPLVLLLGSATQLANAVRAAVDRGEHVGVLALQEDLAALPPSVVTEIVGTWHDPERAASRLFDALRALDACHLDVLYARQLADPSRGLGRALADRLRRAAQRVLDP